MELIIQLFFSNFKMRQLFTKFRVSDHSLEIESGRYKNITREERKCKNCNLNEIISRSNSLKIFPMKLYQV
jgi:hypothetical protein